MTVIKFSWLVIIFFVLTVITALEFGIFAIAQDKVDVWSGQCTYAEWDTSGIIFNCNGDKVLINHDVFENYDVQTSQTLQCIKSKSTILDRVSWKCSGN